MGEEEADRLLLVVNTRRPGQAETHHHHDEIVDWLGRHTYAKVLMVNTSPFTKPAEPQRDVPAELSDWLGVPVPREHTTRSGDTTTLARTVQREMDGLGVDGLDICGNADDPVFDATVAYIAGLGRSVRVLDPLTHRGSPAGE